MTFDIQGAQGMSTVLLQDVQQFIRDAVIIESQGDQVVELGHSLVEQGTAVDRKVETEEILNIDFRYKALICQAAQRIQKLTAFFQGYSCSF